MRTLCTHQPLESRCLWLVVWRSNAIDWTKRNPAQNKAQFSISLFHTFTVSIQNSSWQEESIDCGVKRKPCVQTLAPSPMSCVALGKSAFSDLPPLHLWECGNNNTNMTTGNEVRCVRPGYIGGSEEMAEELGYLTDTFVQPWEDYKVHYF